MSETSSTNLWLLLETLARRRRFVLTFVILTTAISVIVSFLLPKYYEASALLLPPKDVSVPMAGLGQISEVVSVTKGLNLPVMVTTSDVYARMLKSRRIADRVIYEFKLVDRYQARNRDEAYLTLLEWADFRVTDEGLLLIAIEDRDPQIAA
ncbi:MAG: Wzz/FepE/Etk N-terminal domain-containing protein, partial [candidate division Zixibacteria bacterium]|nr:Wzz/FepE/Etk N-terminal domain-containing protein [candidate division Zixibacteria bacterium]